MHLCQNLVLTLAHCFPGSPTTKTAGTGPACQGSNGVNRGPCQGGSSSRAGPAAREHGFRQARLPGCWQAVHTGGSVSHTCRNQASGEGGEAVTVCCHGMLEHEGPGMYGQLCAVCLLAVRGTITQPRLTLKIMACSQRHYHSTTPHVEDHALQSEALSLSHTSL